MSTEPKREEVDAMPGAVMLEFGTSWCGHCRRAQPLIAEALAGKPEISHIKVEDGAGKRLGRSFTVKRWPTLVFLKDGKERARLVRPAAAAEITAALADIAN
jgi:thioredoxin 1